MREREREIPLPPHVKKYKKNQITSYDKGGYFPSKKLAEEYSKKVRFSNYHKNRLIALKILLKKLKKKLSILDFGCGDGLQFKELNLLTKSYVGIDQSNHMINLAEKNLIKIKKKLIVGSVKKLKNIKSKSIDLFIALNVLGYLSNQEIILFFREIKRIIKKNSYFLTMNGNSLFNFFALNFGTKKFLKENFNQKDKHINLLLKKNKNLAHYSAKTFNPLEFNDLLKKYDFTQEKISFASLHKFSPEIGRLIYGNKLSRLKSRNLLKDPNKLKDTEMWKNYFQCSIFAVLFKKN